MTCKQHLSLSPCMLHVCVSDLSTVISVFWLCCRFHTSFCTHTSHVSAHVSEYAVDRIHVHESVCTCSLVSLPSVFLYRNANGFICHSVNFSSRSTTTPSAWSSLPPRACCAIHIQFPVTRMNIHVKITSDSKFGANEEDHLTNQSLPETLQVLARLRNIVFGRRHLSLGPLLVLLAGFLLLAGSSIRRIPEPL